MLVAIVVAVGAWWILPLTIACILLLILLVGWRQPLRVPAEKGAEGTPSPPRKLDLPTRFWLYAAAAFLYGIIETLNGNWAVLYLSGERGVSERGASLALTAFWAMVTVGRILVSVTSRRIPARWIYVGLPIALTTVFQLTARVEGEVAGILAFGATGLACSAFLPLSISLGSNEFPRLTAIMVGELIAFYQLGYGLAAFGVGPLHALTGLPFSTLFAAGSIVAACLAAIALLVVQRHRSSDLSE
jgi:MFS transporter, FHS family, glucose/mannose:H+ symporter